MHFEGGKNSCCCTYLNLNQLPFIVQRYFGSSFFSSDQREIYNSVDPFDLNLDSRKD